MPDQNTELTQNSEPKKTRVILGRMWSVILGISGLVLVASIIIAGALLAGHVWNPKWNPFKSESDKVIRESIFRK